MHIECKSTDVAYIDKVRNMGMTKSHCVSEFVDGMIQRGASFIKIRIDNPNKTFSITGDCVGMTFEEVQDFSSNFKYSKTLEKDKNKISFWGVGTKDAAIVLSDIDNSEFPFSHFTMSTAESRDNDVIKMEWDICRIEKKFQKRTINKYRNDQQFYGTSIMIENSLIFSLKDLNNLREFLNNTYSKNVSEGVKITVETNVAQEGKTKFEERFKVTGDDPIYLSVLGDNIKKDGLYISEDKTLLHVVKTVNVKNREYGRTLEFKLITVYVSEKRESKTDASANKCGIYTELGGRRITYGGNLWPFMGLTATGGGMGRIRLLIVLPEGGGPRENPFGLMPNKSAGIVPIKENDKLEWYLDENENSVFSIIKHWFTFGKRYYEGTNSIKGKNKAYIFEEVAEDLYEKWVNKKKYEEGKKKGHNKKNPSSKEIGKKAKNVLKKIDETDDLTFYIARDKKEFVALENYDDSVLSKEFASALTKALFMNGVSGPKVRSIIIDYQACLSEVKEDKIEEFASSSL